MEKRKTERTRRMRKAAAPDSQRYASQTSSLADLGLQYLWNKGFSGICILVTVRLQAVLLLRNIIGGLRISNFLLWLSLGDLNGSRTLGLGSWRRLWRIRACSSWACMTSPFSEALDSMLDSADSATLFSF